MDGPPFGYASLMLILVLLALLQLFKWARDKLRKP